LRAIGDRIRGAGGQAFEYVANLAQEEDCERVVVDILAELGHVDVLVSNAGRSIRRSGKYQGADRFHDFQRLMALNFFGGLKVALGLLPDMIERRSGHIINVSSFAVPTRQPRFCGYAASKSAADAALQSIAGEVWRYGISTSSVYMPLVQTKMVVSKGHSYDHVSMLTTEQACEYIEHAIIRKEVEVVDTPSRFLALVFFFRPSLIVLLNSLVYGSEGERPPDEVAGAAPAKVSKPRPTKKTLVLSVGTTLMWFFSRAELILCIRCGMPWFFRDVVVVLVASVVIALLSLCEAVAPLARLCLGTSRSSLAGERLPAAPAKPRDLAQQARSQELGSATSPASSAEPSLRQVDAQNGSRQPPSGGITQRAKSAPISDADASAGPARNRQPPLAICRSAGRRTCSSADFLPLEDMQPVGGPRQRRAVVN